MLLRRIKAQHPSVRDDIADLITRRPLPGPRIAQIDPFLFLNHHGPQTYPANNRGLPFGPHPHRGFETVTFILDGSLSHSDSGGHESIIRAGGVQWMTAGRGIVHAELSPDEFKQAGGPLEILQLWVNLPSRLKMTEPRYIGLQREHIPCIGADNDRAKINLIAGIYGGRTGPIVSLLGVTMMTVEFSAGARLQLAVPASQNIFLYVVKGELEIDAHRVREHHLIEFDNVGDIVEIFAHSDASILFGHADPIGEPVVSHGPFVMNTREEIMRAIRDYQEGKFGE